MRRFALLTVAVMMPAVLVTPAAVSQELSDALRIAGQGLHYNAHALGMGNAYSTLGYDFSALLFNPATMAVNDKFSWTVTANANAFLSTTDYYGSKTDFSTSHLSGDQTGLTMPFKIDSTRVLVIGLGYTQSRDYNLGFKYEGLNQGGLFRSFTEVLAGQGDPTARALGLSFPTYDGSGNYLGDQTILGDSLFERGYLLGEGGLSHYSVGTALKAAEGVYFGASASYNTGHFTSDLNVSGTDINDVYPVGVPTVPGDPLTDGFIAGDYRLVRDKQYRGWDARFGVLYKFKNLIGLSTSFHLPGIHEVEEETFVGGSSQFATNSVVVPQTKTTSKYKFRPPGQVTAGAMTNLWIITGTAEATFVDYSGMEVTSVAGTLADQTLINKRIKDELRSVVNLNLGAEVRLPFTGLSARAGGLYHPSPFGADPSRFAQKAVTLGFGINSNNSLNVDVGYAYAWRRENKTDDDTTTERKNGYHTALFTVRVAI